MTARNLLLAGLFICVALPAVCIFDEMRYLKRSKNPVEQRMYQENRNNTAEFIADLKRLTHRPMTSFPDPKPFSLFSQTMVTNIDYPILMAYTVAYEAFALVLLPTVATWRRPAKERIGVCLFGFVFWCLCAFLQWPRI